MFFSHTFFQKATSLQYASAFYRIMATSNSGEIEAQSREVQQIKSDLGDDCRVIKQIGAFAHVLDIKLKCHLDIHITFQLESNFI